MTDVAANDQPTSSAFSEKGKTLLAIAAAFICSELFWSIDIPWGGRHAPTAYALGCRCLGGSWTSGIFS